MNRFGLNEEPEVTGYEEQDANQMDREIIDTTFGFIEDYAYLGDGLYADIEGLQTEDLF